VKWLTTLVLLETDGTIRQKHLLPLDLSVPAQKQILTEMVHQLLEVGITGLSDPLHEVRLKVWTRLHRETDPDPWENLSTSSPSSETGSLPINATSEATTIQPGSDIPPSGKPSPSVSAPQVEPSNPAQSSSKQRPRGSRRR